MASCGEKHTCLLAVNGMIWWSGEKKAVGKVDPNIIRKNKFEAKDEKASYQYTFLPYFDPTQSGQFNRMKFKFISSNFNSRINFAINDQNQAFRFGVNEQFEYISKSNDHKYVFGSSGKGF